MQTKKQYNNDNQRQNIQRERNILYIRKQSHESLKMQFIGQKRAIKLAEQTVKTTVIRRIAVRETSGLRYNGDPNDGPPMMDNHCTMVSRGQRGPQLGSKMPRYASLGQQMRVFFNLARTETDPWIVRKWLQRQLITPCDSALADQGFTLVKDMSRKAEKIWKEIK